VAVLAFLPTPAWVVRPDCPNSDVLCHLQPLETEVGLSPLVAQMRLSILRKVSRQLNRSHSLDSHHWKKQAVLGICPSAVREWPTDQPRNKRQKGSLCSGERGFYSPRRK
jgi:hypothetical protein